MKINAGNDDFRPHSVPGADPGAKENKGSAKCWSEWQDLKLRPPPPERGALPAQSDISNERCCCQPDGTEAGSDDPSAFPSWRGARKFGGTKHLGVATCAANCWTESSFCRCRSRYVPTLNRVMPIATVGLMRFLDHAAAGRAHAMRRRGIALGPLVNLLVFFRRRAGAGSWSPWPAAARRRSP